MGVAAAAGLSVAATAAADCGRRRRHCHTAQGRSRELSIARRLGAWLAEGLLDHFLGWAGNTRGGMQPM